MHRILNPRIPNPRILNPRISHCGVVCGRGGSPRDGGDGDIVLVVDNLAREKLREKVLIKCEQRDYKVINEK